MSDDVTATVVPDDDDTATGGPDLWRVAGALTVIGLALIGAAILAGRVQHPVRLPEDDLAEQYREGWQKGRASILPELEAERAKVEELAGELTAARAAATRDRPPAGPFTDLGETFGKVAADDPTPG